MALDLKILIEGDPAEFLDAIDKVKKESEDLDKTLSTIGTGAAIAFAAFSGAIVGSVIAFRESERVLAQTEATLQSTGFAAGLTAKEISTMALSLQDASTFGDEAIITGQNLLLTFTNIGKTTFPRATQTMLDMSTAMGTDLSSSATLLGKALNDPKEGLSALSRVGIKFTEETKKQIEAMQAVGDVAGAQNIILAQLETRFGGSAKAAAGGLGSLIQFKEVVGDIVEGIGKEFAPAFAAAGTFLTDFAKKVRDSDVALKIIARILLAGAGMSGFIAAVTLGALAVSKVITALKIMQIALGATRVQIALTMGALTLGIGLVLAFLPEIIAFAKDMITAFTAAKDQLLNLFTNLFKNIGNIILSYIKLIGSFLDWKKILTGDLSGIRDASKALGNAVGKAVDDAFTGVKEVKQAVKVKFDSDASAAAKEIADKEAADQAAIKLAEESAKKDAEVLKKGNDEKLAIDARHTANVAQQEKIRREIIALEREGGKAEVIKIKEEEIGLLKTLDDAKTANDRELSQVRLDNFRAGEDEKIAAAIEKAEQDRISTLNSKILKREEEKALDAEFAALNEEDRLLVQEQSLANLSTEQIMRRDALIAGAQAEAAEKKKGNEARIKDEIAYGKTFATINAALNSDLVKGTSQATGQLTQLQQSRSSTLAGIGKAAAVVQIGIDTAKSAMSIFSGFSTIPIVGPALGVAGAAAAVAFGAEKLSKVRSAQDGGIVPGSGSGDIVPAFLEPGEIVVPRALSPTFAEEFSGLSPDPNAPRKSTEVKINTIIGTEDFVRSNIIPAIKDATELNNANLGVS